MLVRNALSRLLLLLAASRFLAAQPEPPTVFGYSNFDREARVEENFLAVPDARLAGQHLKTLTAEPHLAATLGDRRTADYVAQRFRAAGLETEIIPYRVLLNQPRSVSVQAFDAAGRPIMTGPSREHVDNDPYQDDPRLVLPFNGSSASGDVTGDVVYANYGRLEDFDLLAAHHIDIRGKIVLCRYGANFRGVKVYIAEQRGAAAILLYSDPADDGFAKGDAYPAGPWRPETGIQYGSVQYLFKYPGDPETPGVASTLDLPDSARVPNEQSENQPHIVSIPLSYHDAEPILSHLKGPAAAEGWQGALPFHYHLGPGGVRIHLSAQQDYQRRIIWDVVGKIRGAELPNESVLVGNHRDAWAYGAVDPSSGTAAMLEAVHGFGALLRQGWRPRRTIVFCSWDAEEEGLMGSTEWVEQHAAAMQNVVAYFNVDVAVAGPDFSASAVPSLKQFLRELTRSVRSPSGGTVYQQWRIRNAGASARRSPVAPPPPGEEIPVGDLGSGSDYTPFLQHAGVPSTDIGSGGPYGVYHSVFDNFAWYTMNADPSFVYLQQMARVLGLEALRMADTDVLPFDYVTYAREIDSYLQSAQLRAQDLGLSLDFASVQQSAQRFDAAAQAVMARQLHPSGDLDSLNAALRQAETALLIDSGLPNRSWYKHAIYAPGEFTGYAAVVLPGVNEAIDARDAARASGQLLTLAAALDRAARVLDQAR